MPEFDRPEVLNAALDVFITDGYEASSISKLLEAMELNRGSLYSSFGDKESLFREVMTTYVDSFEAMTARTLVGTSHPLQAIKAFFTGLFLHGETVRLEKGCLLFNTISELANTNKPLAKEARNHIFVIRELFCKRLQEAKDMGLIASGLDISAQADTLIATMAGLRLLGKMGVPHKQLEQVIDTVINGFSQTEKYFD